MKLFGFSRQAFWKNWVQAFLFEIPSWSLDPKIETIEKSLEDLE